MLSEKNSIWTMYVLTSKFTSTKDKTIWRFQINSCIFYHDQNTRENKQKSFGKKVVDLN